MLLIAHSFCSSWLLSVCVSSSSSPDEKQAAKKKAEKCLEAGYSKQLFLWEENVRCLKINK